MLEKYTRDMDLRRYFVISMIFTNILSFLVGGLLVYGIVNPPKDAVFELHEQELDGIAPLVAGEGAGVQSIESALQLYGREAVYASKNGTRYYTPTCSAGFNRIKPENIVWYPSPELAKEEGLSLAASCQQ